MKSRNNPLLICLILLFFCITGSLLSETVSLPYGENIARNWMQRQNMNRGEIHDISLKGMEIYCQDGYEIFFIFNFHPEGWVIVAADDSAFPIIAYNTTGSFNFNNINTNTKEFLNIHIKSMIDIIQRSLSNSYTIEYWDGIYNKEFKEKGLKTVGPLVSSKWDQNYPWNSECPEDPDGPGGHVYAGCVAVAMGQLMKYYSYPEYGQGSHSYYHSSYGNLSADFENTHYDFLQMDDILPTDAAGILLYHAGVSVNMDYGPNGSGAYSLDALSSLIQYFGYNPDLTFAFKDYYSDTAWINLLKSQLDYNYPILYRGETNSGIGHAFICDGYDQNDLFHFNWGWSGYGDGYYNINNLNPGGYNFSIFQAIGVDVIPSTGPDAAVFPEDISFSPLNPVPGDEVILYARIHNIGQENIESGNLYFYYSQTIDSEDFHLIGSEPFDIIYPDSHIDLSIIWYTEEDIVPSNYIITARLKDIMPYDTNSGNNSAHAEIPLPVELLFFSAMGFGNIVNINWMTASEVDNLGFNLYRLRSSMMSSMMGIAPLKLNDCLIPGQGTSTNPCLYNYKDMVKNRADYIYVLETVSTSGQTDRTHTRLRWLLSKDQP